MATTWITGFTSRKGALLDLPTSHRIPLTWLIQHGSEAIRYRTLADLAPEGAASAEVLETAAQNVTTARSTVAITKKQKDTGAWAGNLLGLAPSAAAGIKDVGTIPQYRRLLQLGYPRAGRPFKLADRLLFRILSRDEDPGLLFEYQKVAKEHPGHAEWLRDYVREAATCALAEAGYVEDPRIRGSAHRIATAISTFLRSPLAEKPLVKAGSSSVLHPEAHPPTWYTLAMIAALPNLQRERAGFVERLGQYLGTPAPKKAFSVAVGKKRLKSEHVLLGNPIVADAKGHPKDLPLALHFIELLARIRAIESAPVAKRVLARLFSECDEQGVWHPHNLRSAPKAGHKITYHAHPLQEETKSTEGRAVDVTFRLALIARLMGMEVEVA